ncbi:MAG: ATP-binding protein, partial [Lachnospiraceae bacterium]|nr:ATP-binding protein [Lachnospiraceae bacterium]
YFQRILAESFNNVDENDETAIDRYYVPFLFEQEEENSEFEIVVTIGNDEYKYGFEYNNSAIVKEWLYRRNYETNRNMIIIERDKDEIVLGASVRKECEAYKKQIPNETLALSFYNKLKLETNVFNDVYSEIMDILVTSADIYDDRSILEKFLPSVIDKDKENLVEFLTAIDTGIVDIGYDDSGNKIEFYTVHKGKDGKDYELELYNESDGTIRSILIYINARVAVTGNKTMFVDELNVKLHPLLLKFIVDLFYDEASAAQLIYTTHDTTLLDKKFFRRDQIWFVQKDEFGYSQLSSLSDFKVRSDASFEKDYLAGVYGGIPLLKDFDLKEGD